MDEKSRISSDSGRGISSLLDMEERNTGATGNDDERSVAVDERYEQEQQLRSTGDISRPTVEGGDRGIPPEIYDEDRNDNRPDSPERDWMAIAVAAVYVGIGVYALWLGSQVLYNELIREN